MEPGVIYQIRNLVNGKVYVGSTINREHRQYTHFHLLKKGQHHSKHLQGAFDLYGESSFVFEIIESGISKKELLKREQYWLNKLQSFNDRFGYNIALDSSAPMMGRKQSKETLCKVSAASKEWHKKYKGTKKYNAYLEKLSRSLLGHEMTDETKIKISEKAKQRTGTKNPFYGKTHSKETKKKLSEQRMGRVRSEEAKRKTSETLKRKRVNQGESNGSAKLTDSDVLEIKRRLILKEKYADIAKDYGVSTSTIGAIKNELIWKHVMVV